MFARSSNAKALTLTKAHLLNPSLSAISQSLSLQNLGAILAPQYQFVNIRNFYVGRHRFWF
jgi:hypothetical protein